MYRSCIFCSGKLGSNDSIEHFPVGRTLAFDAAKGRLWAVCPKCARWNLAPIEERWEAIEEAERQFRDTRLRAQSENVGLARLRDGTRLVRVGKAVPGELAVWRYGERIARRARWARWHHVAPEGTGLARRVTAAALVRLSGLGDTDFVRDFVSLFRPFVPVGYVTAESSGVTARVRVRREHLDDTWVSAPDDGKGLALHLPFAVALPGPRQAEDHPRKQSLVLRGREAKRVMWTAMVHVNPGEAPLSSIAAAARAVNTAGSPGDFLNAVARRRLFLNGATPGTARMNFSMFSLDRGPLPDPDVSLALEMALNEEHEQQALEGELASLDGMWREAEEIAAIADALPDGPLPDATRAGAEA